LHEFSVMTSSNNKRVMSAWDMQFLDAEDNGDVLVGDDKVEDKTSSKDLKPWTTDFYVYLLSVVDCMMFKRKKTDWLEHLRYNFITRRFRLEINQTRVVNFNVISGERSAAL